MNDRNKALESRNLQRFMANGKDYKKNVFLTIQPKTAEYLKHKNITVINPERFNTITNLAATLREKTDQKRWGIFDKSLIEYYNRSSILLDQMSNPNHKEYGKYIDWFENDEEKALFALAFMDPRLDYYNTYMKDPEKKVGTLKSNYGFVSKELLEIERLYDFVTRYREKGHNEEQIQYLANKLYHLEGNSKGR